MAPGGAPHGTRRAFRPDQPGLAQFEPVPLRAEDTTTSASAEPLGREEKWFPYDLPIGNHYCTQLCSRTAARPEGRRRTADESRATVGP